MLRNDGGSEERPYGCVKTMRTMRTAKEKIKIIVKVYEV